MAKDRVEFEQSAEAIDQWIDTLELEDTNEIDGDELGESLDDLNLLYWAGAADSDLCAGVTRARRGGCGWAPIAVALGISRREAHDHYVEPSEQLSSQRLSVKWVGLLRAWDTRVAALADVLLHQRPPKI